jgi:prevent-host-death family protein
LTFIAEIITIAAIMIIPRATTISAMDLRREPRRVLDQVYYQGRRFIVERAGEPKAVLVPLREFEQMERGKREAREQLTNLTTLARVHVAQSEVSEKALEAEIATAVAGVRAERKPRTMQSTHEGRR